MTTPRLLREYLRQLVHVHELNFGGNDSGDSGGSVSSYSRSFFQSLTLIISRTSRVEKCQIQAKIDRKGIAKDTLIRNLRVSDYTLRYSTGITSAFCSREEKGFCTRLMNISSAGIRLF